MRKSPEPGSGLFHCRLAGLRRSPVVPPVVMAIAVIGNAIAAVRRVEHDFLAPDLDAMEVRSAGCREPLSEPAWFEPVQTEIKTSNVATVAVRLLNKPSGRAVTDAVIVQMRIVLDAHDTIQPSGCSCDNHRTYPCPSDEAGGP